MLLKEKYNIALHSSRRAAINRIERTGIISSNDFSLVAKNVLVEYKFSSPDQISVGQLLPLLHASTPSLSPEQIAYARNPDQEVLSRKRRGIVNVFSFLFK